jgi:hypothetical protein
MSKTKASYTVSIDHDASGLPTRLTYSPSTPVYPAVAIQSHDPPCAWCGGEVKPHFAASDLDLCTVCATPRVRPTAKPAAAASRDEDMRGLVDDVLEVLLTNLTRRMRLEGTTTDTAILAAWQPYGVSIRARLEGLLMSRNASLIAYVDNLLDLLQEVGGMSAEWCETKLQEYEALLKGQ